jgi:membrane fusion protein, heavy metal efflux system
MLKMRIVVLPSLVIAGLILGVWLGATLKSSAGTSALKDNNTPAGAHAGHDHENSASAAATSPADWCTEHRVPESECTVCHPELKERFKADGNWCGEHDVPESHCRNCNPNLTFAQEPREPITAEPISASVFFPPNRKECASDQALIRFASAQTAERIGLKVEPVIASDNSFEVESPAEIVFDESRVRAVTLAVPVTVISWLAEPGSAVASGQPLAELQSPQVADLKSRFLSAHADWTRSDRQWKRAVELHDKQMISQAELDDAAANTTAASSLLLGIEGQLRAVGLTKVDLDAIIAGSDASPNWILRADLAASLLERRAPLGEQLEAGSTLALVGDPSGLWIRARVRETDLAACRLGQTVEFTADGESLGRIQGRVIWVAQYLDPVTRTGEVRAAVDGKDRNLRAHLFGRARFLTDKTAQRLLIPKDAVQWEGCCHIVFVQEAIDRYRPKKVTIERGDSRHYLVAGGVNAGDLVVTNASFLLKTELNKESLGAGCAGE